MESSLQYKSVESGNKIDVAQLSITYFPKLQSIFATRFIPFWEGMLISGADVTFFVIIEIEKHVRLIIIECFLPSQ